MVYCATVEFDVCSLPSLNVFRCGFLCALFPLHACMQMYQYVYSMYRHYHGWYGYGYDYEYGP